MQQLLIDALATHRITHFITDDYLSEPLRVAIVNKYGTDSRLTYLVHCTWCSSIYVGAGVALGRKLFPNVWPVVATALALSSAASLTETLMNNVNS